jgi:hypothetical protein
MLWKTMSKDNIKLGLKEIGWIGRREWMSVIYVRYQWQSVMNTVTNLRIP